MLHGDIRRETGPDRRVRDTGERRASSASLGDSAARRGRPREVMELLLPGRHPVARSADKGARTRGRERSQFDGGLPYPSRQHPCPAHFTCPSRGETVRLVGVARAAEARLSCCCATTIAQGDHSRRHDARIASLDEMRTRIDWPQARHLLGRARRTSAMAVPTQALKKSHRGQGGMRGRFSEGAAGGPTTRSW